MRFLVSWREKIRTGPERAKQEEGRLGLRSCDMYKSAESTFPTLRAPGGPLSSAYRKRNGKRATSSFIAATLRHSFKRLKEVDEFFLIKRPI
jgi:hypothetical protein